MRSISERNKSTIDVIWEKIGGLKDTMREDEWNVGGSRENGDY